MNVSSETIARLRLHLVNGLGPRRIERLLGEFGSAEAAWQAGPAAWERARIQTNIIAAAQRVDERAALEEIERLTQFGGWMLTPEDEEYPSLLREIPSPPQVLFGVGLRPRQPLLAIVGTRRPTEAGRVVARQLGQELSRLGAGIVSGLAAGIDAAAHEGCLQAAGHTVAVLAHGLDRCFPSEHKSLLSSIAKRGSVVTEYPLGTAPRRGHFVARNRIISGMCLGTVVVEAGPRSGAMRTAAFALEQGREVFAVPGDVRRWASKGPHQLIREGATLTESAVDVWEGLPGWAQSFFSVRHSIVSEAEEKDREQDSQLVSEERFSEEGRVLAALAAANQASLETLVQLTGLGPTTLLAQVTEWELAGIVVTDAQGRYRLAHDSPPVRGRP